MFDENIIKMLSIRASDADINAVLISLLALICCCVESLLALINSLIALICCCVDSLLALINSLLALIKSLFDSLVELMMERPTVTGRMDGPSTFNNSKKFCDKVSSDTAKVSMSADITASEEHFFNRDTHNFNPLHVQITKKKSDDSTIHLSA